MTLNLFAAGAFALTTLLAPTQSGASGVVVTTHRQPRHAPEARRAYDAAYHRGHRDGRYDPRRHASFRRGGQRDRHGSGPPAAYASGYRRGFERAYHKAYVQAAGYHPRHDGYCDRHGYTRNHW
jgi:hypothetical protein